MHTEGPEQLERAAGEFARTLTPHTEHATVVTLSGELGAGKTAFAQGIARALGVAETVASPTFVIEKVYALKDQRFDRLIHIDAYRLKEAHELEVLWWHELITDPKNLIVLEWPERVITLMPTWAIRIHLDITGDGRIITIHGGQEENRNE